MRRVFTKSVLQRFSKWLVNSLQQHQKYFVTKGTFYFEENSMKRSSLAVRVVLLIGSIVAITTLVQAQYRTSIQGVVTDATGAVVPGATLTLTNPATGGKIVRVSDETGVFNFNALAAAPFRLEVVAKGFEKKVIDNLVLTPDQTNGLNVQLEIGSESQTVNVDAASEPL